MTSQNQVTTAYLGIGSNIDADANISRCIQAIEQTFVNSRFSRTFESKAVGFEGDNFLNLVAEIQTELSLADLIVALKLLEDRLGRVRGGAKFSSRHIDIDILLYGSLHCKTPIVLPREEIYENAYVLWPLAELAPELIDPKSERLFAQLWNELEFDSNEIKPIDNKTSN